MGTAAHKSDLQRLRAARAAVAELLTENPLYAPIFERLDREVQAREAAMVTDPIDRARMICAAQSAMA